MDEGKKKTKTVKKNSSETKAAPKKKTTTAKKVGTTKTQSVASASKKKTSTKTASSTKTTKAIASKSNATKATTKKTTTSKKASTEKAKSGSVKKSATTPKGVTATKKKMEHPKEDSIIISETNVKNDEKFIISEEVFEEVSIDQNEEKNIEPVVQDNTIEKHISFTNCIIAAIIVVWILILLAVGFQLYGKYQEKLYDEGYFNHEKIDIKTLSLEDLHSEINGTSTDTMFILFNQIGEEENYILEKDLYQIMQDYNIQDNFYYVDVTNEYGKYNCSMDCVLNQLLETSMISNVPAIVYVEDHRIIDVAQREDQKVLEAADFVKLLDIYEFEK